MAIEITVIYLIVVILLVFLTIFFIKKGRRIFSNNQDHAGKQKGFLIIVVGWVTCYFTIFVFMELPSLLIYLNGNAE